MLRTTETVIAALLLGGTATPLPHQGQTQKVVYVNSQVILQNTPGVPQADSTFQRELARYQARARRLQARFDSATTEFNRVALDLSPAVRQQRQQELAQMQQRAQLALQDLRDSAQARRDALMAPITQRITAVIEGIRAEYNYAIVFDVATLSGGVVAADPSLDISRLVIQRLQPGAAPSDASRPPER